MNILIVDNEEYLREDLKNALERIIPGNSYVFADGYDSAVYAIDNNNFDIAFLDIHIPGKNGIELAAYIKRTKPDINIVMVTAFSQYALDAHRLFVSGYLLKPVMDDELREVINNLRNPVATEKKRIEVKCFGNFDIMIDGRNVVFKRKKEKELLAYLICLKGASASRGEVCGMIFDDYNSPEKDYTYLKKIVSELKKDLQKYGAEDLLTHTANAYSINTDMIHCDYYDYLIGKQDGMNKYTGEFMNQYSWAEEYIYELENYIEK